MTAAYGFVPVPMIITEPAIGYDGGAFLISTQKKEKGAAGKRIFPGFSGTGEFIPKAEPGCRGRIYFRQEFRCV
jgi:hypothetical protein